MAPGLVRTKVPGIYKRGKSYVVKQRDASGKIRTVSVATMAEAQDVKATIRAEKARGDLRPASKVRFDEYAPEWIRTYSGRTASGLKESTRDDYRRALERHAIPFFNRRPLTEIEPRDIKLFAAHIAESGVAQHTVRLALAPVKALLATAFEDGLIRSNPSSNVRITIPNRRDTREEQAKALSEAQLNAVLDAATDRWRPLLELLANTGMRIGEGCALEWSDVDLDEGSISVRRAVYRGVVGTPKSRFGRRSIPIAPRLRPILEQLAAESNPEEPLVFPTSTGTMHDPQNVLNRGMKPAAEIAGVPWAGLHTLRHTFASTCFRNGCNAKQVQRMLGHHSAAFTLETYIHLLPEDLPDLSFLV